MNLGAPGMTGSRFYLIGLNPSTADHIQDDPTNRRIADFSRRWGYGGYVLGNLFAYRSPDPKALKQARDPIDLRMTPTWLNFLPAPKKPSAPGATMEPC